VNDTAIPVALIIGASLVISVFICGVFRNAGPHDKG
jgi:hypothetical protein